MAKTAASPKPASKPNKVRRAMLSDAKKGGRSRSERQAREAERELEEGGYLRTFEDVSQFANPLWRKYDELQKSRAEKDKFNPRMVSGPQEVWEAAVEYFEWAEKNPLYEAKVFNGQRGLTKAALPKMRAFTIEGLCIFLGISRDTWNKWGRQETHSDLTDVIQCVNSIIREQKFAGAAVDLLNATIISRDLGLAEKQELSGPEGGPLEVSAKEVLLDRISRMQKAGATEEPDETDP